ncbi:LpqN/LpqT family lipoprotein [Mycobacterium sp. 3519A]|uniref:LpqN/LpqT family lipoprotein n=1 Tax=Mycobacterium sp. 3519A TaxID=2057184 RepID=UPI000C7C8CFD|nr:LpqN/LpqT family lipoprotein [Mycobacterium sp. 3519A]
MKRAAIGGAAAVVAGIAIVLSGCGSDTKTAPTASTPPTHSSTTAKGPQPTIASYIAENNIQETPVKHGDAGSPKIDLTPPAGWADADSDTPDWAYGALVYKGPGAGDYTPSIVALMSKLTGRVDPQKILDVAPGELTNLPGWKPMSAARPSTLGNYRAVQLSGTWTQDGQTKVVAQKTVVIPEKDGVYVLQLNADGLEAEKEIVGAATDVTDSDTKITP